MHFELNTISDLVPTTETGPVLIIPLFRDSDLLRNFDIPRAAFAASSPSLTGFPLLQDTRDCLPYRGARLPSLTSFPQKLVVPCLPMPDVSNHG